MRNPVLFPRRAYEPEAKLLFARLPARPDATRRGLISSLVTALKLAGVWALLDGLYLLAAADAGAARCNLIAPRYDLAEVSGPSFTADRGYAGDGAASYLDTGFNPSSATAPNYKQDSAHIGIWSRTNLSTTTLFDVGSVTGNLIRFNAFQGTGLRGNIDVGTLATYGTISSSLGHFVLNRSDAGTMQAYQAGSSIGTVSAASSGTPAADLTLLAAPGAATFSTRQLAAAHYGASLSATQVAALQAALQTYMTAVGA